MCCLPRITRNPTERGAGPKMQMGAVGLLGPPPPADPRRPRLMETRPARACPFTHCQSERATGEARGSSRGEAGAEWKECTVYGVHLFI